MRALVWEGELDLLTGRSLGFTLLALAGMGYYYMPMGSFCKQIFIFNLANMGLFIIPAFYGGTPHRAGLQPADPSGPFDPADPSDP